MKHQNILYAVILVCATAACMWVLPALVKMATREPQEYPFVYYGSVLKGFGLVDYKNKEMPLTDLDGNRYTAEQFDSLMPLLNYRQLMSDGRLPDSIGGREVTPPLLRMSTVIFRYKPEEVSAPESGLYILQESMPRRGGLSIPPDVFRLRGGIEFVDAATNRVDEEKSVRFRKAMEKAGFAFPARWAAGNPTTLKSYDEGYFCLDARGRLFHLKMVNGRPYVRDTHAGDSIDIRSFSMYEAPDRRFYGFMFDRKGSLYILESDLAGGYEPRKLGMGPVDPETDRVTVMGNLLYWTVTVETPGGRRYYALDTPTLGPVAEYHIDAEPDRWERVSRRLFPVYLTMERENTSYVAPHLTFTGVAALAANVVAALLALLATGGGRKRRVWTVCYLLLTGIAGLAAMALLPRLRRE